MCVSTQLENKVWTTRIVFTHALTGRKAHARIRVAEDSHGNIHGQCRVYFDKEREPFQEWIKTATSASACDLIKELSMDAIGLSMRPFMWPAA